MAQKSNISFTYSSTQGASAALVTPGGRTNILTSGVFAASTTLKFEVSVDNGTTYVDLYDIAGSAVTATVNGASGEQYYTVDLPTNCFIRPNCTAGTMTSGTSWVCQSASQV